MMDKTMMRARNNAILHRALTEGRMAGVSESEIFERLVHYLLDLNDKAMQEQLDALMHRPIQCVAKPSGIEPDLYGDCHRPLAPKETGGKS